MMFDVVARCWLLGESFLENVSPLQVFPRYHNTLTRSQTIIPLSMDLKLRESFTLFHSIGTLHIFIFSHAPPFKMVDLAM